MPLRNETCAVASPLRLGVLALCTGPVCPSWKASLLLLIAAELSGRPQNGIDAMWNLIANKLRILVNLTTVRRRHVHNRGGICSRVPAQVFMPACLCLSLDLDICDMWGAVKF